MNWWVFLRSSTWRPLGTYTGWNLYASGWFKDQVPGLVGGYIPFAKTKAERLASGDPRPSLEERYGLHKGYMCVVRKAAAELVKKTVSSAK